MLADFSSTPTSGRNMSASDPSDDLDSQISKLVCEYWEEHHMPLLLSRLGGQDDGNIGRLVKQRAPSLAAYLRTQIGGYVRVVQHSTRHQIIGAIPADVEVDATDESIDALLNRTQDPTEKTVPRFHPAFWTAFRKPLETPKRRYISLQAPIRFQDVPPEDLPDGFIEIEPQYIVDQEPDPVLILQKAQSWLSDHALEEAPFLWQSRTKSTHLPSTDLLGRLLHALEPEELRRISMPLDIVHKLKREPL